MLRLKLQYFPHLMRTADSLDKSLMLGKIDAEGEEGVRGWDGWMASLIQRTWVWANSGRWKDREAWCAAIHGVTESWTRFSNWKNNGNPLYIYTTLYLFIHQYGHWCCFFLLAIMNSVSVNTGMQIPVQVPAFHPLGYISGSEIAGSYGNPVFDFWRTQ